MTDARRSTYISHVALAVTLHGRATLLVIQRPRSHRPKAV